jgi:hypothetical protein
MAAEHIAMRSNEFMRRPFPSFAVRRILLAAWATVLAFFIGLAAMYLAEAPLRDAQIREACMYAAQYADLYEVHPCHLRFRQARLF